MKQTSNPNASNESIDVSCSIGCVKVADVIAGPKHCEIVKSENAKILDKSSGAWQALRMNKYEADEHRNALCAKIL